MANRQKTQKQNYFDTDDNRNQHKQIRTPNIQHKQKSQAQQNRR